MSIILNGSTGITTPADTVTGNETVGGTLAVNGVSNALGTPGTSGNVMTSNGTAWVSSAPASGVATAVGQVPFSTDGSTFTPTQKIVQGTAVASTSGTSIDFTGIPSWVKRITVMFNGVSSNGSSLFQIQIGASSFVTSGYVSVNAYCGASYNGTTATSGFLLDTVHSSTNSFSGTAQIYLIGSNAWVHSSTMARNDGYMMMGGSSITLSGTLDRVRITTVNGTDTFDAGSINIQYE